MVSDLKKIFEDSMSSATINTEDNKDEPVYYGEPYRRKLSDSNYPRKPNYKENIQQDKKQNHRHFKKLEKLIHRNIQENNVHAGQGIFLMLLKT